MEKCCSDQEVFDFLNNTDIEINDNIEFQYHTSETATEPRSGKFKSFNINDARPGIRLTGSGFYDADRIVSGSLTVVK